MILFKDLLKERKILIRQRDESLKESLIKDASERMSSVSIQEVKIKFRFEHAYESIRELADAFLARDGYKTYSHEAALAYLIELKLVDSVELERLDLCRKIRNDSKYYGKEINVSKAKALIEFLKEIFQRIFESIES